DDSHNATAARLNDHRRIIHDRIPIARPHMIRARYRIKRYPLLGQHRTDAHFAAIAERGAVLTYDVFAKARPLLDTQDAADGTRCGTDGSADSPDRALRVCIGRCRDKERGNRKQALVHVRSYLVRLALAPGIKSVSWFFGSWFLDPGFWI